MRGSRRGFLGALAGLPALVGLGKRATGETSALKYLANYKTAPKPREMTTVILRWADGKQENLSVPRPLEDVVYAPRHVESSSDVFDADDEYGLFPRPPTPTIEKVAFRFCGESLVTDLTDTGTTIPIYEEVREHIALYQRNSGILVCRDCGQEWPPKARVSGECRPGPSWNVGPSKAEVS
jgi:hypothetical protein